MKGKAARAAAVAVMLKSADDLGSSGVVLIRTSWMRRGKIAIDFVEASLDGSGSGVAVRKMQRVGTLHFYDVESGKQMGKQSRT